MVEGVDARREGRGESPYLRNSRKERWWFTTTKSRFESLGFLNVGMGFLGPETGKDGLLIDDVDAK